MRIKELRNKRNLTQEKLAKKIGVSRSTIAMWETEGSEPDKDAILALSTFFEVSTDYLLGNSNIQKPVVKKKGIRIPVYGEVAAGIPILAIENYDNDNPDDWEEISEEMASKGEYIALRIKGDSMEPRICRGDIVIVRLQPEIENGEVAIVQINGDEATCKKIKKTPEGLVLISANPSYDPMFYTPKQVEELPVRIIGKVVELRAKTF